MYAIRSYYEWITLQKAISAVKGYAVGLWAVLLANPFLAFGALIAGATTALVLFSDKIVVSSDKATTLV